MTSRMRSSNQLARMALTLAIACALALTTAQPRRVEAQAEPKQLSVYSPQATYSIPIIDVKGQPYVGLVELLEPLGSIEARRDGKKYKVQFTAPGGRKEELQFQEGKEKGKVRGDNLKLPANFVFQGERGYVPLAAATDVVQRLLGTTAQFRAASQRLLIGTVENKFSLDLRKGTPSRLLVGFTSPVNPTIATEPGRLRLTFKRSAVVSSGADTATFSDPLITGAAFSEHDGIAQLDITATAPLIASFADGGKTIIVTGAPAPVAAPPPPAALAQQTQALGPVTPKPPSPPPLPRFLVLIDPAHGGTDIGAAITPDLPEKDVVLALARRVQHQLNLKGVTAYLLRSGDSTIELDQRATSINSLRPAVYLSIHAANTGKGVHIFTSLLPVSDVARGGFVPWDTAQAAFLDLSGTVAGSVAAELETRKVPNTTLVAPLRPMNNVAAPAIAIELAPNLGGTSSIADVAYQDLVAQSIAAGVAAVRSRLPEVSR